ncbi:DUF1772 domain-containing protein [Nocardia otitidiscaviarum]|uniref:anthrone oxygenase family protein n=1 Tax=Nocardia otitidiscaviarum TaxID=1823 RepID=UPI001893BE6B|nr:anthrone oxygenase family protein [Nocardia otitidiscaviarum]MBF6241272.1 DUF1772 domain-containing protein [Nocardia otitidiscaviarum]
MVTGRGAPTPGRRADRPGGVDRWLLSAAAAGTAISGGVFFDFSFVVMPGLRELPPAVGIEAMQAFNQTAVRPPLMVLMYATAGLCAVLMVRAVMSWNRSRSPWILAAAGAFLFAVVVVTGAANVPISAAMDALDPSGTDTAARWDELLTQWIWWNHARTLASIAAAVGLLIALRSGELRDERDPSP